MVTFWMKDGKAHGWWKWRENLPLWVSPSFKYTFNCKYTYNHHPNTPSTILQIHKFTFKYTFNCSAGGSNLFPRTKSSRRCFLFFQEHWQELNLLKHILVLELILYEHVLLPEYGWGYQMSSINLAECLQCWFGLTMNINYLIMKTK